MQLLNEPSDIGEVDGRNAAVPEEEQAGLFAGWAQVLLLLWRRRQQAAMMANVLR
jgi:hypothetical protein